MTDKKKTEELNEQELDQVTGGSIVFQDGEDLVVTGGQYQDGDDLLSKGKSQPRTKTRDR